MNGVPITINEPTMRTCAGCGISFSSFHVVRINRPGWSNEALCSIGCVISMLMARIEKLEAHTGCQSAVTPEKP